MMTTNFIWRKKEHEKTTFYVVNYRMCFYKGIILYLKLYKPWYTGLSKGLKMSGTYQSACVAKGRQNTSWYTTAGLLLLGSTLAVRYSQQDNIRFRKKGLSINELIPLPEITLINKSITGLSKIGFRFTITMEMIIAALKLQSFC